MERVGDELLVGGEDCRASGIGVLVKAQLESEGEQRLGQEVDIGVGAGQAVGHCRSAGLA
jgi:hypothetical protein